MRRISVDGAVQLDVMLMAETLIFGYSLIMCAWDPVSGTHDDGHRFGFVLHDELGDGSHIPATSYLNDRHWTYTTNKDNLIGGREAILFIGACSSCAPFVNDIFQIGIRHCGVRRVSKINSQMACYSNRYELWREMPKQLPKWLIAQVGPGLLLSVAAALPEGPFVLRMCE